MENFKSLISAVESGDVECVRRAADKFDGEFGQVRDGNGRNVLHLAAQRGDEHILALLIEELKVPVESPDSDGVTPLMVSAQCKKLDAVKYLLNHGADVLHVAKDGSTPLHAATAGGSGAIVALILERPGVQVDAAATTGTPLSYAAVAGDVMVARILISRGAKASTLNSDGVGMATMAAKSGNADALKVLLEAGASATEGSGADGMTAMHVAAAGSVRMVQLLIEHGASADQTDAHGFKPVDVAAMMANTEVLEYLLPKTTPQPGIDWTAQGVTSAAKHKRDELVKKMEAASREDEPPAFTPSGVKDAAAAEAAKVEGDASFRTKEFAKAVEAYTRSLDADDTNSRVWANRAAARLKLDGFVEALEDAQKARQLDKDYAKAWYREGEACKALKKYEDAAVAFLEATRIEPDNKDLKSALDSAIAEGRAEYLRSQKKS